MEEVGSAREPENSQDPAGGSVSARGGGGLTYVCVGGQERPPQGGGDSGTRMILGIPSEGVGGGDKPAQVRGALWEQHVISSRQGGLSVFIHSTNTLSAYRVQDAEDTPMMAASALREVRSWGALCGAGE